MDNKIVVHPYNRIEYYSAINMKELLIHATGWMDLKDIMLRERSHFQKAIYCMLLFI